MRIRYMRVCSCKAHAFLVPIADAGGNGLFWGLWFHFDKFAGLDVHTHTHTHVNTYPHMCPQPCGNER